MKSIIIAPSLLSANFACLLQDIRACEEGGADALHLDIMDGHFVPNITFGPQVVAAIRANTSLVLDCHLMIREPDRYVPAFVEAGANWISVHVEASTHLHRTLSQIRGLGAQAGIALNPTTPLEFAFEAAPYVDFILLMSVNPGFGGQQFIPGTIHRIKRLRQWLEMNALDIPIEVDGGISSENATVVVQAGARILVSGAAIFSGDIKENISSLRKAAKAEVSTK
ncbi:MAG: ribulose-phosphate 3-epimerase [Bacteroidota bacterium]|nr:ribulose-phosphate 3-epimerase [Candidatus Kapabacteria bacterium]MCS7302417.1 ribulose-phosphate 3-epimerase [Candidatus Kapabacteria bacterium]MCX7937109.1 ribulose-phosphate 3-epimerase [Chlorobiota bacterium]MDW8074602.1 ribulose-phosphate 3-epimerase [Bacteroidota bacterium]MDW8270922.1 ribulose-phosphate 3-epimerase [Bacteroidota bacterium]